MSRIYAGAESVLVWLGGEKSESDEEAFAVLPTVFLDGRNDFLAVRYYASLSAFLSCTIGRFAVSSSLCKPYCAFDVTSQNNHWASNLQASALHLTPYSRLTDDAS